MDVYPVAVQVDNGQVENWNERFIIPPMLKLLQMQKAEIDDLKTMFDDIKNTIKGA